MRNIKETIAILFLGIAILGFIPTAGLPVRLAKYFTAEWAAIIIITLYLVKDVWMRLFIFWALFLLTCMYSQLSAKSFYTIFVFIMFYQALLKAITKENTYKWLNGICVIVLLHVLWVILQALGVWAVLGPIGNGIGPTRSLLYGAIKLYPDHAGTIVGLLSNPNMSASLLAIGLPAFFRKKWIWGAVLIWVILITFFRTCFAGMLLSGIVTVWFACRFVSKKYSAWIVFVFLVGGLIICPKIIHHLGSEGGDYLNVWSDVIKGTTKTSPVKGLGLGQFKSLYPLRQLFKRCSPEDALKLHQDRSPEMINKMLDKYPGHIWLSAHNDYIQAYVEMGILGPVIILGFLVSLRKKIWKHRQSIAVMGLTVCILNAGVNFLLHTTPGILFFVWLAILEKGCEKWQEPRLT